MSGEFGRPHPPVAANEVDTLLGFLDFQRATFEWKCSGLDASQLQATTAASTMTLGGMLKHLALVEDWWFSVWLHDREEALPWRDIDWDADPDWEWRTAADDPPEELRMLWRDTVTRSRAAVQEALRDGGLSRLSLRSSPEGERRSLRWILCEDLSRRHFKGVGHMPRTSRDTDPD